MKKFFNIIILTAICLFSQTMAGKAQKSYFIDGYHGGFWGHYPAGYTGFIADMLDKNAFWKLNLEIEPVTWDAVQKTDPLNYKRFKDYVKDQSLTGRVEFVNPSYGQSYLFNIQGESVIRQLDLGIRKIHEHFPEAVFTTYSSEEPCFTSALPQILKSFGYKYASLKNPNTCWGGYTTAFGGELVNWTGPDGSAILTVPRYQTEALKEGSTWQTTAWNNSKEYIQSAIDYGIQNPIAMCIQDAGWRNGPWLGQPKNFEYKTWRDYIANTADKKKATTWNFTQENVQVSLVWGAQILQKLAQNNRRAENKIIMDEKLTAISSVFNKKKLIADQFKDAWQNLLLAQHHDSWIVPYNIVDKQKKLNWGEQVKIWTDNSNRLSDSVLNVTMSSANATISSANAKIPSSSAANNVANWGQLNLKIYNTVAGNRNEVVSVKLNGTEIMNPVALNAAGKEVPSQLVKDDAGNSSLLFQAQAPAMGFASYTIKNVKSKARSAASVMATLKDGKYLVKTSLYDLVIDAAKGGVIESLVARKLDNAQFVQPGAKNYFNEMRGYFYQDSAYHSSADAPAKISIVENGPLRVKLKIEGKIAIHSFVQYLTLTEGEERIDVQTKIDWQGNPGIGQDYAQKKGWQSADLKKAFYNDSFKLSALFPLNLKQQKVYKNAAFDVLESKLSNTFFNTWDSIKNNIIVNWVDVADQNNKLGMALLTDHTTSYSHDKNGLLGLTLQYSGMGLWGRNYSINGPSELKYALLPHAEKWDKANIWTKSLEWNEPLQVVTDNSNKGLTSGSLISLSEKGYEISSVQMEDGALVFRVFNASASQDAVNLSIAAPVKHADLIELNGSKLKGLELQKKDGRASFNLSVPRFGIRTVKVSI